MLIEGTVSILALIAASSMFPLDYFQINVSPEKFQNILPSSINGIYASDLQNLAASVEKHYRTYRRRSLACRGMAQIFSSIPGLKAYVYWYHFVLCLKPVYLNHNRCRYKDRPLRTSGIARKNL